MRRRPRWLVATMVAGACALAGCSHGKNAVGDPPGKPLAPPLSAAESLFWQVLGGPDYDRIPALLVALGAEAQAHPDEPRPALLLGVTELWRLAEPALAHTADPGAAVKNCIDSLTRYQHLAPSDPRVPTWIAPALLGRGRALAGRAEAEPDETGRDAMRLESIASINGAFLLLDKGVEAEPRFNLFGRMMLGSEERAGSARFQQAVADVAALHRARLGPRFEGSAPDVRPLLAGPSACDPAHPRPWPFPASTEDTTFNADPRCWNSWKTPFAYEGFWLYSGDVMLKAGDVKAALAMYENARALPSYAHWPYAFLVEERVKEAAAWAARLGDADPDNDPPIAPQLPSQCVICHQRADRPAAVLAPPPPRAKP